MSVDRTIIAPGLTKDRIEVLNGDVFTVFVQQKDGRNPDDPESCPLVTKATLEPDQTQASAGSEREEYLVLEFKPYSEAEQFVASSMVQSIAPHNRWRTHLGMRHEHDGLTGIVSAKGREAAAALLNAFEIATLPVQTEAGTVIRRPAISAPMMKALRKELNLD